MSFVILVKEKSFWDLLEGHFWLSFAKAEAHGISSGLRPGRDFLVVERSWADFHLIALNGYY